MEAESDVESSSTDDGPIIPQRGRRRRYCLEDCDCEKPRGRLCECEKRDDGMCNDECQCDPAKLSAARQLKTRTMPPRANPMKKRTDSLK